MTGKDDQKEQHLRKYGAFYSDAESVSDPLFDQSDFFDPRDLVLVKYEMLRRVRVDGISVVDAVKQFGFSRAGYYKTLTAFQNQGLIGLIPARSGPRHAHKLNENVLEFIDKHVVVHGSLAASQLASLLLQEYGLRVHPRSIERAMARRKKKGR